MRRLSVELAEYWQYKPIPKKHPLRKAATGHCLNSDKSKLFLFGGFDANFRCSDNLYVIKTSDFSTEDIVTTSISPRINHEMYFWNDSIIIAGGASFGHSSPILIYSEIVIITLPSYRIRNIQVPKMGLRFNSFFDYARGVLYYSGGLDTDNVIYKTDILSGETQELTDPSYFSRSGATSQNFENSAIVFSGFTRQFPPGTEPVLKGELSSGIPVCHSDYYLITLGNDGITHKACNEFVGRTFSKAVIISKYNKIFFVFGTYNGMETSRSIVFYDYKKDYFNDLFIQEFPWPITEALVFYLDDKNKLYIAGGVSNSKVQNLLWELDLEKIDNTELN
jgi:hypothetical protein